MPELEKPVAEANAVFDKMRAAAARKILAVRILLVATILVGCVGVSGDTPSELSSDVMRDCRELTGFALPGMHGCAALDVAQSSQLFLDPPREALAAMSTRLRDQGTQQLVALVPRVDQAQAALKRATSELSQGKVCAASKSLADSTRAMESVRLGLVDYQNQLARATGNRAEVLAGDLDDIGMQSVVARGWLATLAEQRAPLDTTRQAVDLICRQARTESRRSIVLTIDGSRHRMLLLDGTVLGVRPEGYGRSLYEKASVNAQITRFADGTGFLDDIRYDAPPAFKEFRHSLPKDSCLAVRLAPVQPAGFEGELYGRAGLLMTPGEAYGLHPLDGYFDASNGHYILEAGMRLAVIKKPCQDDAAPITFYGPHYRHGVEIKIVNRGSGQPDAWLGDFLKAGQIASNMDLVGEVATLQIRYLGQYCAPVPTAPNWNVCTGNACPVPPPDFDALLKSGDAGCADPQVISSASYPFLMFGQATLCVANYETTEFDLEDHDLASYRSAKVNKVTLSFGFVGTEHNFWATGFSPSAPVNVGNGQVKASAIPVLDDQAFAIFSWEPSTGESSLGKSGHLFFESGSSALLAVGAPNASGLRWPRVVGHNNGNPYAFSCFTPKLVRDVLHFCSPIRGFYRFPFEGALWTVGQGSCSPPGNTHCCGCKQEFAVDLPAPVNTPILTARGGKVVAVENSVNFNCWKKNCSGKHAGNFVQIQHQDGTVGLYAHMPQGGPAVIVGQHVRRGDLIGHSGNTGNSSEPHLHIHQQLGPGNGQTSPMRFEVNNWAGGNYSKYDCRALAKDDDGLISTNHTH